LGSGKGLQILIDSSGVFFLVVGLSRSPTCPKKTSGSPNKKQKHQSTRRAYKLDVGHFMLTLTIL
jgi:hypothetical protein